MASSLFLPGGGGTLVRLPVRSASARRGAHEASGRPRGAAQADPSAVAGGAASCAQAEGRGDRSGTAGEM